MDFFEASIELLQTLVVVLGAGLGVWGLVNLLEGYGSDNAASNAHWQMITIPAFFIPTI